MPRAAHPRSSLPWRHVHLDFHTAGVIPGIGSRWSAKEFASALTAGRVASINLFAKCHHGWSYHPTRVGQRHPGLRFDLLGRQITVCRKLGVRAVAYLSCGFDERSLDQEPGWQAITAGGEQPLTIGYRRLCFNTPYRDHLLRQIEEVAKRYGVDGFWLDIENTVDCVCRRCRQGMIRQGLDPAKPAQVRDFALQVQRHWIADANRVIRRHRPRATISHNGGHVPRGDHAYHAGSTHTELESLPTGGWGYDHFPVSALHAATQGRDYLGMTGRFHTVWGEFGGWKPDYALRWECARMAALGARCAIGDQLHPDGHHEGDTQRKIGLAFGDIAAREAWLEGASLLADVAVLSAEAVAFSQGEPLDTGPASPTSRADAGAVRALLERQVATVVVAPGDDLRPYRVVVLPDRIAIDGTLRRQLEAYVRHGGSLLLTGESGCDAAGTPVLFPATWSRGRSQVDADYLCLRTAGARLDTEHRLVKAPFYAGGGGIRRVTPPASATVIADLWEPWLTRDATVFCGHQHAPARRATGFAGAWIAGRIAWCGVPLFTRMIERGQPLYRDLALLLIDHLLGGRKRFTVRASTTTLVTLQVQPRQRRLVLHVVAGSPAPRGEDAFPRWGIRQLATIEEPVQLPEMPCSIAVDRRVTSVRLVPAGTAVPFRFTGGQVTFTIPPITGQQLVEITHE